MVIIAGEGYATEAIRVLLEKAPKMIKSALEKNLLSVSVIT
ncbi:hypothetical protein METHB2_690003 [Candidatus Methylobacter favarea]|uniref:Uncharacterized protein n=1 Tax=Candidatus Methylobacter favarea TaxID=2707345 RepID=A0A8S0XI96_9GAMM|nr:hypothetical protein METHB2_690003 [Candidatus Methylobacter favarea]